MYEAIIELDLHGMTTRQARAAIDAKLRTVRPGTYRLRLIHGYRGGTEIRTMVRQLYRKHPKVLRLELGLNPGETDLVLREF